MPYPTLIHMMTNFLAFRDSPIMDQIKTFASTRPHPAQSFKVKIPSHPPNSSRNFFSNVGSEKHHEPIAYRMMSMTHLTGDTLKGLHVYRVFHHLADLGWIDFDLDVPPILLSCPANSAKLSFAQAESKALKI